MEGRGEESADFVREPSFSGRREGYVFKTGDQGTGYYKDSPPDPDKPYQPVAPQPAKTFVIKTNKPLLKVKGRTADLAKGGRKGAKPGKPAGPGLPTPYEFAPYQ